MLKAAYGYSLMTSVCGFLSHVGFQVFRCEYTSWNNCRDQKSKWGLVGVGDTGVQQRGEYQDVSYMLEVMGEREGTNQGEQREIWREEDKVTGRMSGKVLLLTIYLKKTSTNEYTNTV